MVKQRRVLFRLAVAFSLWTVAVPAVTGQWFLSDADGETSAPISAAAARREQGWIINVDRMQHETVRSLYHNGTLISEQRLSPEGKLIERYQYSYRDGKRIQTHAFGSGESAADEPLYTDSYTYTSDGMLREIRRQHAEDGERSSRYVFVGGRLHEELHQSGAMLERISYDRSERVEQLQQLRNGTLISSTRNYYRNGGPRLDRTVEERHSQAGITVSTEYFDREQRSIATVVSRGGRTLSRSERSYGPHGITQEVHVDTQRRRVISFEYDEHGELRLREERLNERLQSRIIYRDEDRRIEERFQSGALILRIIYEKDEQVAREIIRDGDVIRSR